MMKEATRRKLLVGQREAWSTTTPAQPLPQDLRWRWAMSSLVSRSARTSSTSARLSLGFEVHDHASLERACVPRRQARRSASWSRRPGRDRPRHMAPQSLRWPPLRLPRSTSGARFIVHPSLDAREPERDAVLEIREVSRPTFDDAPHAYLYRRGVEGGNRDLPRSRRHDRIRCTAPVFQA